MIVREACAVDAAGIQAIWNPMIRESEITFTATEKTGDHVKVMISDRKAAGHCFLVAEDANRILGFATYTQFRGGVGYARTMEHSIILARAAQGRGLGRSLLCKVEDHAKQAGAHTMFAGVSSGNPSGIAFHAALGYREVAILNEVGYEFGRWYDLHLMQKYL